MLCPWESSRRPHSSNQFSFSLFGHQQTQSKQLTAVTIVTGLKERPLPSSRRSWRTIFWGMERMEATRSMFAFLVSRDIRATARNVMRGCGGPMAANPFPKPPLPDLITSHKSLQWPCLKQQKFAQKCINDMEQVCSPKFSRSSKCAAKNLVLVEQVCGQKSENLGLELKS